MGGWVLKMKLMLSQLSTKLELKLKLKLSLAINFDFFSLLNLVCHDMTKMTDFVFPKVLRIMQILKRDDNWMNIFHKKKKSHYLQK